jgi:hypothetical protein
MTTKTEAIRALNDELRTNFCNRHGLDDGWRRLPWAPKRSRGS